MAQPQAIHSFIVKRTKNQQCHMRGALPTCNTIQNLGDICAWHSLSITLPYVIHKVILPLPWGVLPYVSHFCLPWASSAFIIYAKISTINSKVSLANSVDLMLRANSIEPSSVLSFSLYLVKITTVLDCKHVSLSCWVCHFQSSSQWQQCYLICSLYFD